MPEVQSTIPSFLQLCAQWEAAASDTELQQLGEKLAAFNVNLFLTAPSSVRAAQLLQKKPAFRAVIDHCCALHLVVETKTRKTSTQSLQDLPESYRTLSLRNRTSIPDAADVETLLPVTHALSTALYVSEQVSQLRSYTLRRLGEIGLSLVEDINEPSIQQFRQHLLSLTLDILTQSLSEEKSLATQKAAELPELRELFTALQLLPASHATLLLVSRSFDDLASPSFVKRSRGRDGLQQSVSRVVMRNVLTGLQEAGFFTDLVTESREPRMLERRQLLCAEEQFAEAQFVAARQTSEKLTDGCTRLFDLDHCALLQRYNLQQEVVDVYAYSPWVTDEEQVAVRRLLETKLRLVAPRQTFDDLKAQLVSGKLSLQQAITLGRQHAIDGLSTEESPVAVLLRRLIQGTKLTPAFLTAVVKPACELCPTVELLELYAGNEFATPTQKDLNELLRAHVQEIADNPTQPAALAARYAEKLLQLGASVQNLDYYSVPVSSKLSTNAFVDLSERLRQNFMLLMDALNQSTSASQKLVSLCRDAAGLLLKHAACTGAELELVVTLPLDRAMLNNIAEFALSLPTTDSRRQMLLQATFSQLTATAIAESQYLNPEEPTMFCEMFTWPRLSAFLLQYTSWIEKNQIDVSKLPEIDRSQFRQIVARSSAQPMTVDRVKDCIRAVDAFNFYHQRSLLAAIVDFQSIGYNSVMNTPKLSKSVVAAALQTISAFKDEKPTVFETLLALSENGRIPYATCEQVFGLALFKKSTKVSSLKKL